MPNSDHITFDADEQKDGTWVVAAYCPGQREPSIIKGFKTKHDALMWIEGPRSGEWRKVWGAMYD